MRRTLLGSKLAAMDPPTRQAKLRDAVARHGINPRRRRGTVMACLSVDQMNQCLDRMRKQELGAQRLQNWAATQAAGVPRQCVAFWHDRGVVDLQLPDEYPFAHAAGLAILNAEACPQRNVEARWPTWHESPLCK